MTNQLTKALQNNKLLENVNITDLDLSNINGELLSRSAGETIYREGDAADAIFLVVSGEINLVNKRSSAKTKSLVLSEKHFFGQEEFFEEPTRHSAAVALKDSYLIKLPEEEVQKLIQQDTAIYENLRSLPESDLSGEPQVVSKQTDNVSLQDDMDLDLKIDSEIEGITINDLSSEDEIIISPGDTIEKFESSLPIKEQIPEENIGEDILRALEAEDSLDTISKNFNNQETDYSEADKQFFKNFDSDLPTPDFDFENKKTPPVVPPLSGKSKTDANLINFDFGDSNKDDEPLLDEKILLDKFEKIEKEINSDNTKDIIHKTKIDSGKEDVSDKSDMSKNQEDDLVKLKNDQPKTLSKHKEGEHMTAEELEMINKAAQLVNSNIQLDEVLQNIVDVASNITHADRGTMYLVDKENNELWSKVLIGENVKEVRLKIGEGVAGWVAKSKEIVNIKDVKEDSRFQPSVDKNTGYETKSMLCFPILNREKEVTGVLQLLNSANGLFSKLDEEFLNALSIHAALALENANMVQKLLQSERVDSLGKMANFLIQDIKKPVLVSKRYAEHLKGKDLPKDVVQVLDMMLEQLNTVADLVQTTSSYAEGKKILHTMAVGVTETLKDFSARMEQYVQLKTCAIVNNVESKAKVKLDVKEFFQCYSHIIKNACDAMPDGGRVTVSVEEKGDKVLISLSDEGLGIPETIKEKIFEPFTTHGKKEGTGLGLAITKKIVEAHGGAISVASTLGEGATFTISLPKQ